MRLSVGLLVLLGACNWTFDGTAPELPLVGAAPATSALPRLNQAPVGNIDFRRGADGQWWATWNELQLVDGAGLTHQATRRLVSMQDLSRQEVLFSDELQLGSSWVFTLVRRDDDDTTLLTRHLPGDDPAHDGQWTLPGSKGSLSIVAFDRVLLWYPGTGTAFQAFASDGGFARSIPLPDGVDFGALRSYDADLGALLFTVGADGALWRWALTGGSDAALGIQPQPFTTDDQHRRLWSCDGSGVRVLPYDADNALVLDGEPCLEVLAFDGNTLYYRAASPPIRTVTSDGSMSVLPLPIRRILAFGVDGVPLYSTTPSGTFESDAGDGWLGAWKFMNRGAKPSMSSHGRLHYVENAATLFAIGDLWWADVGGAATHLARNCLDYEVLGDGRVLILDDQEQRGDFNRLLIADEAAAERRWVAAGAEHFARIPDTDDLLVTRYGPGGDDVVRVSIPSDPRK